MLPKYDHELLLNIYPDGGFIFYDTLNQMKEKAKPKQKQKREKKQTEKNTEARLVFTLLTYMIKLKLGIDQESNMATGVHNHST